MADESIPRDQAVKILGRLRLEHGEASVSRPNAAPDRLKALLSDPLTEDQAAAIAAIVMKCLTLEDFFEWLSDQERPWVDFVARRAIRIREPTVEHLARLEAREREAAGLRTFWEQARHEFQALPDHQKRIEDAKARYLADAPACPNCSRPASELAWFYFETPPSTWKQLAGQAGWAVWCDRCGEQVSLFVEITG
ncbi:MAG: hypothetical protein GC160_20240 [Acidobacteria bacterium]|nr:hypothetical protein [Acidobacteriota bacterium]